MVGYEVLYYIWLLWSESFYFGYLCNLAVELCSWVIVSVLSVFEFLFYFLQIFKSNLNYVIGLIFYSF